MMIQIEVECYAGHKADQTPRRFLSEERWIDVEEVVDCRYQVESMAESSRRILEVQGTDRHDYLIKHDLESDKWFLCGCCRASLV